MSRIIYYNPKLKEKAKILRKQSTLAEVILWNYLKGKKLRGYKFIRQKPIDNYIVDFFCKELMLVIEIDGHTHGEKIEKDHIRQSKLENMGVNFLRFRDSDVKKHINEVLERIGDWIDNNKRKG